MRQLIIFARPGICLVSGYVKEIVCAGYDASIVIENYLWRPVSMVNAKQKLKILLPGKAHQIKKMQIQENAFICATIDDNSPELDIIVTGGEITCDVLTAVGFNVRYNGNFDFKAYGKAKETHVFIGVVSDINRRLQNGKEITDLVLSYKKNGEPVSHFITTEKGQNISAGKYAAVCGAPTYSSGAGYIYEARRIVKC